MPESSKRTVAVTHLTGHGAVILAAGASTRIGIPKQLLQLRGQTFLRPRPRPSHLKRDAGRWWW